MPLVFNEKPSKKTISFIDDSVILVERPVGAAMLKIRSEADALGLSSDTRSDFILERFVVGWDKIVSKKNSQPLEFTDENRFAIYQLLIQDKDAASCLLAFVRGDLGN